MIKLLSVIMATYNPDSDRLQKTLLALQQQTLPVSDWELIIVDNNSALPVAIDLKWHPAGRLLEEPRQGLTYARIRAFDHAQGDLIVMVDDDNLLERNYLWNCRQIFERSPTLGAAGGRSLALFESPAPDWLKKFEGSLAIRDLGNEAKTELWEDHYPRYAPIGAGMCIRKAALNSYRNKINRQQNIITDRAGASLGSAGDNDIVLEVLKSGWLVGYYPELILHHLIPEFRMQPAYLARLEEDSNYSWVRLLEAHGILPWKKISPGTLPIRKFKAWMLMKAAFNQTNYIRWRGYCGMMRALAKNENS